MDVRTSVSHFGSILGLDQKFKSLPTRPGAQWVSQGRTGRRSEGLEIYSLRDAKPMGKHPNAEPMGERSCIK